jgi:hypothetical protein
VKSIKPINKFKTYKFDPAPFFFFIDVFPADYTNQGKPNLVNLITSLNTNPIMPLPMRIDRVFNGERSILIRPKDPISFAVTEDLTAIINPDPFLQLGFEKLLFFTEVRSREKFLLSLGIERVLKWWKSTQYLHGNLHSLEEDFSAFLRAYLHTIVKAKILEEDLNEAAQDYCQLIADVCKKRMDQNSILVDVEGEQENVKMYKTKELTYYKKFKKIRETQHHPELVDIEICDLSQKGFIETDDRRNITVEGVETKILKYIPLLFYDDLLECMLQNLKRLEESNDRILDPSLLFERNIIFTQKTGELDNINIEKYSWWKSFDNINLDSIVKSILKNQEEFILSLGIEDFKR